MSEVTCFVKSKLGASLDSMQNTIHSVLNK